MSSVSSASIFTAWGCAEASCKASFIAAAEFGMSLRNYASRNSKRRYVVVLRELELEKSGAGERATRLNRMLQTRK